jgi:LysM repeat protein
MKKRSSASARILAVITLVVALVVAIVVIGAALGGDSGDSNGQGHGDKAARKAARERRNAPATYIVKSGDTLTAIAHHTGVTVARIQALNPQVDPQILIAGEKLKLK